MNAQLGAEQAARLQAAERRWLASSRARLLHATTRRRTPRTATARKAGAR